MKRRLLDLCLLAYPADRAYLRDLTLEMAERRGIARQLPALLLGGLRARLARVRPARAAGLAAAVAIVAFVAVGAVSQIAPARADHDVERLACRSGACAQLDRRVAARERAGWDCSARGEGWECVRGS